MSLHLAWANKLGRPNWSVAARVSCIPVYWTVFVFGPWVVWVVMAMGLGSAWDVAAATAYMNPCDRRVLASMKWINFLVSYLFPLPCSASLPFRALLFFPKLSLLPWISLLYRDHLELAIGISQLVSDSVYPWRASVQFRPRRLIPGLVRLPGD